MFVFTILYEKTPDKVSSGVHKQAIKHTN